MEGQQYFGGNDAQNTSAYPTHRRHGRTPYGDSSRYRSRQSQFSQEDGTSSYTIPGHGHNSSRGQQAVTPSTIHPPTHHGYGTNVSQRTTPLGITPIQPRSQTQAQWVILPQETATFNHSQYPTTYQVPPTEYSTYVQNPMTDATMYHNNPTTYHTNPAMYHTNGSMQEYLARREQAPALTNSDGTYSSADVSVQSGNTGGSFPDAAPVWEFHKMKIAELGPADQTWMAAGAPVRAVQVVQQGGCESSSCQACTGVHSCSNISARRRPQHPPSPPPPPQPLRPLPPPPPHPVQHNVGGGGLLEPAEKVMGYCPIANCKRGLGSARAPFPRNCNLLEHLRGVHGITIPLKTKLRSWLQEQGYEPDAYLVRVKQR